MSPRHRGKKRARQLRKKKERRAAEQRTGAYIGLRSGDAMQKREERKRSRARVLHGV